MPIFSELLNEHVQLMYSGARRTARLRLLIAALAATVLGLNFGAATGALWLAAYVGCEVWTQRVHDDLRRRPATMLAKLATLATTVWATANWMAMALLFWRTGQAGLQIGGAVILCGLIVHAQCFSARSRLGLAVIGGLPAAALVLLPTVAGGFSDLELLSALTCVALSLIIMGGSAKVSFENARALDAATHAKSDFLASVSHEIRTPMTGIVGVLHLLKAEPISPAGRQLLDEALSCTMMLGQLINDVLDLSKVEAGKLELSYEPTDPQAVLTSLCGLLAPQAQAKGIYLRADSGEDLGWTSADPVRLRQCLFNLVGNAVKFTREGGVEVRLTRPEPGRLRVEVADTGPGLTDEAQSRLFQRFEQAAPSVGREHGGTGLGLAITRTLVELMGGTVGVESQIGRGSMFWFEINAQPCAAPVGETPQELQSLGGLRMLLVDDNSTNRIVGSKILESLGADVHVADGGEAAVQAFTMGDFDMVLMDINMPGMDGMEATRIIRRLLGGAAAPIIALTANVMAHQREAYLAAGMDGVVAKPFSPAALLEEVLRVAGAAEARTGVGRQDGAAAA